jgi:hypothetical protein
MTPSMAMVESLTDDAVQIDSHGRMFFLDGSIPMIVLPWTRRLFICSGFNFKAISYVQMEYLLD